MHFSPFISVPLPLDFEDPIKFVDGREYRFGEWSCEAHYEKGVVVKGEVARMDTPHPSHRYVSWGDWYSFELYFPDTSPKDARAVAQCLVFVRFWMSRRLRENRQPRSQTHTYTTIEGSFRA